MVRVFKNMRNSMIEKKLLADGVAPSYFIEGMLSNVPNDKFTGDYVDMVVGIRAHNFPFITTNPVDDTITDVSGINGTSVKMLLQGMKELGTLLTPPPEQAKSAEGQPPPS